MRTASARHNALTAVRDETSFVEHETAEGPKLDGVAAADSAADALRLARCIGFRLKVDGDDLTYEVPEDPAAYSIIDILRSHRGKIVELLRSERCAVVRWINDHFQSSPVGQCVLCGSDERDDPFVAIFVGEDRADAHASCYLAWIADQEAKARFALGIETPTVVSAGHDASLVALRAEGMLIRDHADPCCLPKSLAEYQPKGGAS